MAKGRAKETTKLKVSTTARPDFGQALTAFVFDRRGNLLGRSAVKGEELTLEMGPGDAARSRVLLVPADVDLGEDPTLTRLQALGAYEPVLRATEGGGLVDVVRVPGSILDRWPFCLCLVKGRVVRAVDSRPICGVRVRICEVDRIPRWILKLPDPDILRLRDDLLRPELPPLPEPIPDPPGPWPWPEPSPPGPRPDPVPFTTSLFRFDAQPMTAMRSEGTRTAGLMPDELRSRLMATSAPELLRRVLIDHSRWLPPFLCLRPVFWRLRCDEIRVVTTDANGRFETLIPYVCGGDHPDLYFTVEADLGAGWETVYAPPVPCSTRWNYDCGSEVILRVADPRVPACNDEPDLDGKQVWVISIGRTVSVGEILRAPAGTDEGKVDEDFPPAASGTARFGFGGRLEPRVWFGRTALATAGVEHYLWSVRPLGGGEADWMPLDRQVIRHYTTPGGTAPIEVMGPVADGPNEGRFRIRPKDPPAGGLEWLIADEREDLASGHLVTTAPSPSSAPCGVADPHAGKLELKLELFDTSGGRVDWDDAGIKLRVATNEAPFGSDPVLTELATEYHRIREAGATVAFRMVLHVDNSRCGAEIQPVAGSGLSVDADCGVVTLTGSSPSLDVVFRGGRPGGMAHLTFSTRRGLSSPVADASAAGPVGGSLNGFNPSLPCTYAKSGLAAATLLDSCPQGAFAETLRVRALTVDGYSRLSGLDAADVAAFMLTEPCPGAHGRGRGSGGGGG